jgi:putative nucleotidyltransferase with HDIG domain
MEAYPLQQEPLQSLRKQFHDYVRGFYSADRNVQKNIKLKEEHTARVVDNIEQIAISLGLTNREVNLARIIALFHDIGRFEQFAKYGTYKDGKSENHAKLGLKVLEEAQFLKDVPQAEQDMIKKAIAYHNLCDLPKEETEEVLLFSKLIRDADKLDSLEVILRYLENRDEEKNQALEEHPDISEYSHELVADILHNRAINYSKIKTLNDMKLTFLAWIPDVNFVFTLRQMRARRHLERMMALLPDTPEMQKVYEHLKCHGDGGSLKGLSH